MFRRQNNSGDTPIFILLIAVFTVGLIVGIITLFYIPESIISNGGKEVIISEYKDGFFDACTNNFVMECLWLFLLWISGFLNFMLLPMCLIMGCRGFFVGFSVEYIMALHKNIAGIITESILPQCIISFPVMTIACVLCIKLSTERKNSGKGGRYMILGGILAITSVFAAFIETAVTMLFIKFL